VSLTTTFDWAENVRVHDLRLAMWAWRVDPVGGRMRLVKDIAREHCASDPVITRAYLRVSTGLRTSTRWPIRTSTPTPPPGATRSSRSLMRAYMAAAVHCVDAIRVRRRDEARFLAMNGGVAAKTHHKARAHRARRRNAERRVLFVIKFGLSPPCRARLIIRLSLWRARSFDNSAESPAARVYERVPSGPSRA
jgi:hypothetical protein